VSPVVLLVGCVVMVGIAVYVGPEYGRPYAAVACALLWIGLAALANQLTGGKL